MHIHLVINCEPKALSRARASNGRMYYPQNKQDEMNELSWAIIEAMNKQGISNRGIDKQRCIGLKSAISVELVFYISLPKSLSKKKRAEMLGKAHTQKPDLDNLIKNVLDRANGLLWADDDCVARITASKVWAEIGKIEMGVEYL